MTICFILWICITLNYAFFQCSLSSDLGHNLLGSVYCECHIEINGSCRIVLTCSHISPVPFSWTCRRELPCRLCAWSLFLLGSHECICLAFSWTVLVFWIETFGLQSLLLQRYIGLDSSVSIAQQTPPIHPFLGLLSPPVCTGYDQGIKSRHFRHLSDDFLVSWHFLVPEMTLLHKHYSFFYLI